ncbi:tRNA-dependent cyclodipeptide synthase [Streptomyces morookaense]|uniref:tRNA-dependent cyclodipeptide synthase n=1 Tax=Streptomyces morookaense TaxID=1970 RepID=UPI003407CB09
MPLDAQEVPTIGETAQPIRRTRYKAEIGFVSPRSSRDTFEQHDTCFLGVSLENSNFTLPKFTSMVKWISRRFARCTVLVGDSIHRITLESTRAMAPDEARATALHLGRQFMADARQVFDDYRHSTDFTCLTCSEVQTWETCADFQDRLHKFFADDDTFRSSVESFGRSYHAKRSAGLTEAELERRIRMSSDYFLEEFAVFACLQQLGLPVMVYPGSFSTLTEIAAGLHPDAPQELRDLIVVSLHLKGR